MPPRFAGLALALALFTAASTAAHASFEPVTCKNSFSREQEIAEGDKVVAEVYKTMPVLPDSDPISRYVQQLGDRLVAAAPRTPGMPQQWPFRFHVVASEEINAFALPGGTMFVNLGAIQAAETEAQLAGVMGHEMSHVIMRHSTCNLTKQRKRGLLYSLGAIGSQIALGGAAGAAAGAGFGMAANLDFLHMSRGDEKQADLLGVNIVHDAGYDPRGLAQFFEIIAAKYGKGGAQFLSDHPNPGNRTEYVNAEVATLSPLPNAIKSSPAFLSAHAQAARATTYNSEQMKGGTWRQSGQYASSPESGPAYAGPRAPSGTVTPVAAPTTATTAPLTATQLGLRDKLVRLSGQRYSITYPSSWQSSGNTGGSVTLAPAGGAGSFGVAYGVVLNLEQQGGNGVADAASLNTAATAITQRFIQQNGLQALGTQNALQIAGQPATAQEMRGASPVAVNGVAGAEHDWLVTVARPDGDVDTLIFVAPEADWPTLKPLFDRMLASFRPQ